MGVLNSISGASQKISIGGSALSLIGMGSALLRDKNTKPGIDGFMFDVPLNENTNMSAQITDHYTEANSAIQDHIAIDPLKITLTGKIAEIVYSTKKTLAFLSAVINRLGPLNVFSPKHGLEANNAIAVAEQAWNAAEVAKKTYEDLNAVWKNDPAKNKQQVAFNTIENMLLGRAIISVETPWKTYQNMAIESWTADQDDTNIYETTFTINFKQMRFVGTETNAGKLTGRVSRQKEAVKDAGNTGGNTSFLLKGAQALGVASP